LLALSSRQTAILTYGQHWETQIKDNKIGSIAPRSRSDNASTSSLAASKSAIARPRPGRDRDASEAELRG
jgi:hypothetical protein